MRFNGTPSPMASASTNALKVEPAWNPLELPYCLGTAKLTNVSPWFFLRPTRRDCEIARTSPVPGSTMASEPIAGSFLPTWSHTDLSAAFW